MRVKASVSSGIGIVLLILAFMVFLFYGNVAPGIVFLAIGVVFIVNGAKSKSG